MNYTHNQRSGLLAATLLTLLSIACTPILSPLSEPPRREQPAIQKKTFHDVEDISVSDQPVVWNDKELEAFTSEVRGLMKNQDFVGLDEMAAELRASKARFQKGGGWKIHAFYSLTSSPDGDAEEDWLARIKVLETWRDTTNSIAARASLADTYMSYAWVARGTGTSREVKAEAWPVFEERMSKAAVEIEEMLAINDRCYGFFEVALRFARGGGIDRSQFEKMYQEAIAYDPTYQYFYTEKAEYLLPRWHGYPGELSDFAEDLIKSHGEAEGSKLYYLIVATLRDYKHDRSLFEENNVSWKRTKKGYVQFEKDHGLTKFRVNEFASLSLKAADTQAACNTFKRLTGENDFDQSVWTSREAFERRKAYVLNTTCQMPKADNQAD